MKISWINIIFGLGLLIEGLIIGSNMIVMVRPEVEFLPSQGSVIFSVGAAILFIVILAYIDNFKD